MKRAMKHLFLLFCAVLIITGTSENVFAGGLVTYDGNAKEFIFEPGSSHSPTDLFENFKGVMPGDRITQQVTVKNDSSNEVKVKIYMRSLGAHADSAEFLSKLHMSVAKSEDNEMGYMFDATADQRDGLADWVYLGTLYSGGEVNLDVTLEVPIELGNEFQEAVGHLDWQFKVEEFPVEAEDPKPPQTGDDSNLTLSLILAGVSLSWMIFFMLRFQKSSRLNGETK